MNKTNDFKPGQKVRYVTGSGIGFHVGETGVVVCVRSEGVIVRFSDDDGDDELAIMPMFLESAE